jgi:hypothetical protein
VPVETGAARGTIEHKLQARPVPLWARVTIDVKAKRVKRPGARGSRNPRTSVRVLGVLEGSGKTHYRSGPKRGQRTKGWWSGAIQEAEKRVEAILKSVAAKVERRFNRS